jgi:hypothetical protein
MMKGFRCFFNYLENDRRISVGYYHRYFFVPKEKIQSLEHQIETGDLIAITTPLKNLDIVHVGFAVRQNGRVHLMHASSVSKKVEISTLPLSDYLLGNKSQSGIMVSRLILP